MEPISDPFEFEHVLELLDLAVAELPLSQDVLDYRLNLLIDDALSDLKREHGTQLTTNEEAAAEWLIALRRARRQLKANGTLTTHALDEIRAKGWIVMAWRFWNSVHALHERKTAAQRARHKWFRSLTEYSQVRAAAERLLNAGTHPRNLVSSLRCTAIGQEIEPHTLRRMLQQQGFLPPRKKRKKEK